MGGRVVGTAGWTRLAAQLARLLRVLPEGAVLQLLASNRAGAGPYVHAWSDAERWYAETAGQPVELVHTAPAEDHAILAESLVAGCRARLAVATPEALAYRHWSAADGREGNLAGLDLERLTVTYLVRPGPGGGVDEPVAVLRRVVAGRAVTDQILAPRDGTWVPGTGTDQRMLRLADPLAAEVIARWRAGVAHVGRPPADLRWAESIDGPVAGPPLRAFERAAVGGYLRECPIAVLAFGFDADRRDPRRSEVVPLSLHTDGTWVWSESDAYYAQAYGTPPDPALLAHAREHDFHVPAVDESTVRRAGELVRARVGQ
jgi:hypothetical protein